MYIETAYALPRKTVHLIMRIVMVVVRIIIVNNGKKYGTVTILMVIMQRVWISIKDG